MKKIIFQPYYLSIFIFLLAIIATTLQALLLEDYILPTNGLLYTHYNNYIIYKQAFFHLLHNQDLYRLYPYEYDDLYKYSPTFAVLMFPMAVLPDAIGLFIWNALNVLILLFAIWKLPGLSQKKQLLILGLIFIELLTSLRNSQSNALIAGLIIFGFILLEQKKIAWASLLIVFTVFIKLFGIVAFSLFIFYPNKLKSIGWILLWIILFTALPLLCVSISQLNFLYHSWISILNQDHSLGYGLSTMGWLNSWFGIENKEIPVLIGILLFCLPLLKIKYYSELGFKIIFLSSVLIWIVIFNHRAESPTYIITVTGIAIWYFSQKPKLENSILLALMIFFTILSPTDIFPRSLREEIIEPYVLKAFPCILIWFKIIYDLIYFKPENQSEPVFANIK